MVPATVQAYSAACAGAWGYGTFAPNPTHRVPTAKPSVSFKPVFENGRMRAAMKAPISVRSMLRPDYTSTTEIGLTRA